MSATPCRPVDPAELQRMLDDLLRRNDQLRQQAVAERQRAEDAQRQAEDAQRRRDELQRVLDQTAADFDRLGDRQKLLYLRHGRSRLDSYFKIR